MEYLGEKRYFYPDMVRYITPYQEAIFQFNNLIKIHQYPSEGSDKVTLVIEQTKNKGSDGFIREFIKTLNGMPVKNASHKDKKPRYDKIKREYFSEAKHKFLRDLGLKNKHTFLIVDYKYHSDYFYLEYSDKLISDIKKQKIYELNLAIWSKKTEQLNPMFRHQFCIPHYSNDNILFPDTKQPKILLQNKIELIHVNFNLIQEFYINNALL